MTTSNYRLDILQHVNQHGGCDWVWSLITSDGDRREGGDVDDLTGDYDLDGHNKTAEAERVASEVCRMLDIARDDVLMAIL